MSKDKDGHAVRERPQNGDRRLDRAVLLDAALAIIVDDGLAGLTLRPLAKRLNCSLASLTRQVGSKDQLLDTLIDEATRADELSLEPWMNFAQSFSKLPAMSLMEMTEEFLRMRSGGSRGRAQLKCELLRAAAFQPQLRPAVARWVAVDRRYWDMLADRSEVQHGFDMGFALTCFAIDDAALSLNVEAFDMYRWARRESIRRLWRGLFKAEVIPNNPLYERALSETPPESAPRLWTVRQLTSDRDRKFGETIASIILENGMDAVTHREVGRRAEVPHTSVAYHYPLQEDLLELGMQTVVEMVRQDSLAAMGGRTLPPASGQIGLASFAIAVAAARRPNLRPIVREMRRRRGINFLPWLQKYNPGDPRVNIGNVQTMASVLIGAIVLARAGIRGEVPMTEQLFSQLGDWPDVLAQIEV